MENRIDYLDLIEELINYLNDLIKIYKGKSLKEEDLIKIIDPPLNGNGKKEKYWTILDIDGNIEYYANSIFIRQNSYVIFYEKFYIEPTDYESNKFLNKTEVEKRVNDWWRRIYYKLLEVLLLSKDTITKRSVWNSIHENKDQNIITKSANTLIYNKGNKYE